MIAVGKHSGTSGLIERYRTMGISVDRTKAGLLLERTRAMAGRRKRDLNNGELRAIYLDGEPLNKAA
jgi:homocitrate synthase NifV